MMPSILVLFVVGIRVLFSVTVGLCVCSLVSFVSSVLVDFDGATLSLLCVSHVDRLSMYGWACVEQVFALLCVDVIVTSSA